MMQEQIVEKYPAIESFAKGVNQSLNNQLIGIDEATIANNVNVSDGSLKTTKGYKRAFEGVLPSGKKTLMKHYDKGDATILVAIGNEIYKHNKDTGSFNSIYTGSTSDDFSFVNFQLALDEVTIMTNGKDDVLVYDGSSFRPLKYLGKDSAESDKQENGEPNKAPKGKYITIHEERLWISGNEEEPNRYYYSEDLDVDNFSFEIIGDDIHEFGGFEDIPTWDGGVIIGMRALFDDVVIFKNKNVFRVFGTYPGNFNLIQIFDTVDGNILHRTIESIENTAIWTSTEGIHLFNGVNAQLVSDKVKDYFVDLNREQSHKAVAVIYKRKYILSIPVGDSTDNNLILEFDMNSGAFTTKTGIGADSFIEIGDKLYFTNKDGHIFEYGVGNDFDGKPINMIWQTGNNSYGEQHSRKILNRIYFRARGNGSMKITSISERKEVERIIELTDEFDFYRQRLRNKGRFLKFKIENIDGSNIELREFQYMLDLDYD